MKIEEEKQIISNELVPIDVKTKEFDIIMNIYEKAKEQVLEDLISVKEQLKSLYGYDIISNITSRIKTPTSIVNKMKKKKYKLNYKNLVENINDIAGIRVICPIKSDIYNIIKVIENMPNIKIIQHKDYLKKPKKSGYAGYHLVVETNVNMNGRNLPVKVEIQLRTMAMDFWATNEHKLKYKTNKKMSIIDSKKLVIYAKLLNFLDDKIMKLNRKQELKKVTK